MRIPILKLHNYLLISIQTEIDDNTAIQFQEDLLSKIHQSGSSGVVIDLTSVEIIDSFIAKVLGDVVSVCRAEELSGIDCEDQIGPPRSCGLLQTMHTRLCVELSQFRWWGRGMRCIAQCNRSKAHQAEEWIMA